MELYLHELSEFTGADLNEHGLFGYRYLDHYWTEPEHHAFFIRAGGRLAGFAMIRRLDDGAWSMAEFCVLRKYRRGGIGRTAAHELFRRLTGRWEVRYLTSNRPAAAFWPGVIEELAPGSDARHDVPGWIVETFVVGA